MSDGSHEFSPDSTTAPMLCECDDCGRQFWDDEPHKCQGVRPTTQQEVEALARRDGFGWDWLRRPGS